MDNKVVKREYQEALQRAKTNALAWLKMYYPQMPTPIIFTRPAMRGTYKPRYKINDMEPKLTSQQVSVLRTLNGGENVTNEHKAGIIRQIDAQAPGLLVIVPQIGPANPKPIFGAVLSNEGRRHLAAYDDAKK